MRILIVEDRPERWTALATALAGRGFAVEHVARAEAFSAIARDVPDVLLFGWLASGDGVVLQKLKLADPGQYMALVAIVDDEGADRHIPLALASGADEFARASASTVELCERLDRARGYHPRPTATNVTPIKKPPLWESGAWRYAGHVVADDLEETVGRPMTIRRIAAPPQIGLRGSAITLSLVQASSEIRLSLLVDHKSAASLSGLILGDEAADITSQDDMLRELANVAAGAFKRFVVVQHPVVTIGLPVDELVPPATSAQTSAWQLDWDESTSLVVLANVQPRANTRLPARQLREGMVVVGDVRNGKGMLIVPGGTRLTATTAQRLAAMLGVTPVRLPARRRCFASRQLRS